MGGGLEAAEHLRVDVYAELSLVHELLVPGLHALLDPISKWLFDEGVSQVDEPLSGQASILILVWQVITDYSVPKRLCQHLPDAKALVLGHRQVSHPVAVEVLLLALDQLLEEVNSVAFIGSQVCLHLHREEVVPKQRVTLNNDTYTSRLERYLAAKACAVRLCLALSSICSTITLLLAFKL